MEIQILEIGEVMRKRQKKKVYKNNNNKSYKALKKYFKAIFGCNFSTYKSTTITLGVREANKHGQLLGCYMSLTLEDIRGRKFYIKREINTFTPVVILTDSYLEFNILENRYMMTNPIPFYAYNESERAIYPPYSLDEYNFDEGKYA